MVSPFSKIFNSFLVKILNRLNRSVLIGLLIIGALFGYLKVHFSDDLYRCSILLESPYVNNEILVDLLDDMNTLILEEEYTPLARKIGISEELIRTLKKITPSLIHEYEGRDMVRSNRLNIDIVTSTKNTILVDSIFNGFLQAIENQSYVNQQIDFERKRISNYKEEITKKIEELESLQIKSVDQIAVTQDIFSYHNEIVDLYGKQRDLDKELQQAVAFIFIDNERFPFKIKPDYIGIIGRYALTAMSIWFIIIFGIVFFKTINQFTDEA